MAPFTKHDYPITWSRSLIFSRLPQSPSRKTSDKAETSQLNPDSLRKMVAGKIKELVKKYGKVGLAVHFSISAASITGLFVAIKSNVDVESMLERTGLPNLTKDTVNKGSDPSSETPVTTISSDSELVNERAVKMERNKTADLAASSGGALALALLINKALFPVRVPITLAVTPPVARFLARRNLIKNNI